MQIARLTKSIVNVYVLLLVAATIGAGAANYAAKQTYSRFGGEPDSINARGAGEISNTLATGL